MAARTVGTSASGSRTSACAAYQPATSAPVRAAAWARTSVRIARSGLSGRVASPRRNRRTGSPAQ